jgi:hypothetical protein
MTWLDIFTSALTELGVLNAADPPSGDDSRICLDAAQRLLDNWNADRQAVYATTIQAFTLTPSHNPHTIGPATASPDFTVTSRPVAIEQANILTPATRRPITIRDQAWWMTRGVSSVAVPEPSDLYYDAAWPLGNLWLDPAPSSAYDIELASRILLTVVAAASDSFDLPPGYRDAITLTLAEKLAAPYRVALGPSTVAAAREARARIFDNNRHTPRLVTADSGIPSSGGTRTYDWSNRSGL